MIVYEVQSEGTEYASDGVVYYSTLRAARAAIAGEKNASIDRVTIPPITREIAVNMLNRTGFIEERENIHARGYFKTRLERNSIARPVDASL